MSLLQLVQALIAMNSDANLLAENGGHIELTKHWAKNLLTQIKIVKRRTILT